MAKFEKLEKLTVVLEAQTREAIKRVAEREDRSAAGQVRHWILSALAASADSHGGQAAA